MESSDHCGLGWSENASWKRLILKETKEDESMDGKYKDFPQGKISVTASNMCPSEGVLKYEFLT